MPRRQGEGRRAACRPCSSSRPSGNADELGQSLCRCALKSSAAMYACPTANAQAACHLQGQAGSVQTLQQLLASEAKTTASLSLGHRLPRCAHVVSSSRSK